MKFSAASLFCLVGYARAEVGKPELSLTIRDGTFSSVKEALSPSVSFSGTLDDTEIGGSIDLASSGKPKSIWGQKSSTVGGWNLKTRVELSQGEYSFGKGEDAGAYVTVQGNSDDEETYLWGSGAVSKSKGEPLKVGAKKIFSTDQGKFMVAPRYNFQDEEAKVVLGFEKDDLQAFLTVSEKSKDVLIQHKINDDNSVAIKVADSAFISASVENESDVGTTTVTLTPDDLDLEVKNDGWTAGISASKPILNSAPVVHFSKTLSFQA